MTARIYYFEDLPPGTVLEFGGMEMTEEEIVGFAKRYDPQPFHVDREAGKASIFGGAVRKRLEYHRSDDADVGRQLSLTRGEPGFARHR